MNRRSSRRASSASNVSSRIATVHPEDESLDAASFKLGRLEILLAKNPPGFEDRLDFINMSDENIDQLFVSERVRLRAAVIYPPENHRRTAKQIRYWFNELGNRDKKTIIEEANDNLEISVSHNNSLCWDGIRWTKVTWDGFSFSEVPQSAHDAIPSSLNNETTSTTTCNASTSICNGVSLASIRCMKVSQSRLDEIVLGFMHTCREAFNNREPLSHPTDDRWNYAPPVVGVLANGNDPTDIRWTLEETHHSPDVTQYEHLHFHAIGCSKVELPAGQILCSSCAAIKKRLMDRIDSQIKICVGEFKPQTRSNIMTRSGSLQKKVAEYHKRESKNKSKKLARRDKVITNLLEQTGMDMKVNSSSDFIFCDDVEKETKKFLSKKLSQDSICIA